MVRKKRGSLRDCMRVIHSCMPQFYVQKNINLGNGFFANDYFSGHFIAMDFSTSLHKK